MVMIVWVVLKFTRGLHDLKMDLTIQMMIQDLDDQKHQIVLLVEKVREIIAVDANFTVRMLAEELNTQY